MDSRCRTSRRFSRNPASTPLPCSATANGSPSTLWRYNDVMSAEPKYGRAAPESVNVLPELTLDMLEGKPIPPGLGKTHTPVNVLPPLSFAMPAEKPLPVLQLTIAFRPEATAAQIGRDYHRLFVLLNEQDLAQGGSGLQPVEVVNEAISARGEVQLAFRPIDPNNAARRLAKLIETIGVVL